VLGNTKILARGLSPETELNEEGGGKECEPGELGEREI